MQLFSIYASKKGLRRDRNQDRVYIFQKPRFQFFLIFDGVSSYSESYVLIQKFVERLKSHLKKDCGSIDKLQDAFYLSNEWVKEMSIKGATTLSAFVVEKENTNGYYISIGDSRIYRFSNQYLEQITIDDNLESNKNVITKSLGNDSVEKKDFILKHVSFNNNFLICTDGFYSLMERNKKQYFNVLNYKRLGNIRRGLLRLQRRKNIDDSSFIVIKK